MKIDTSIDHRDRLMIVFTLIILGFLSLLYWAQNRTPDILNHPNNRSEIIVFGDSLAAGVGSDENEGFTKGLEFSLNRQITVLGVSGDTTRDGLNRIEEVTERDAQIVLISLGGNDFIQRVPEETVRKNMDKIISKIQNSGAMVMVLGAPGYRGLYKQVAEDHKAAYVSNILKGLIGRDAYMSDPIHPNNVGYHKISERIAPELKKFIE